MLSVRKCAYRFLALYASSAQAYVVASPSFTSSMFGCAMPEQRFSSTTVEASRCTPVPSAPIELIVRCSPCSHISVQFAAVAGESHVVHERDVHARR